MTSLGERIRKALAGINVLHDDLVFIEKCLLQAPTRKHKALIDSYKAIWHETLISSYEVKKDNDARHAANTWLLETIEGDAGNG